MADYTLDWATANADGANVLTNGGDSVTATVSTPSNPSSNGEFEYHANTDGLRSYYPDSGTPSEVSIDFSEEVSNLTFDIQDIDGSGSNWDDIVEIFAYDQTGNRLDVTFSGLDGQTTTAYTIEGESSQQGEFITVSIDGPVYELRIVFDHGPDDDQAGWITIGDMEFDTYIAPCFVRGTMISTNRGEIAVEALQVGDFVKTADHGLQPIRWIGATEISGRGKMAPICIKKGTIGNTDDLLVSPAHRILLTGWQAELLFGEAELLTSAKSMVNEKTVIVQPRETVEYFHILFDQHEIIFSNGAATESFHPNEDGIRSVSAEARCEIIELFPQLAENGASFGPAARQSLMPHEVGILAV